MRLGRILVLRLGHRVVRDQRVSTHVALTARALGAAGVVFSGERDEGLLESIRKVIERWGGGFSVSYEESWRDYISAKRGEGAYIAHLTMYGVSLPDAIEELRSAAASRDLVLIVGAGKTPPEVYRLADLNVAVTNQPHSEVAALAIALDWIQEGRELRQDFPEARIKLTPSRTGKYRASRARLNKEAGGEEKGPLV